MHETNQFQDFLSTCTQGYDVFYDPKYWKDRSGDVTPMGPEIILPWWAPVPLRISSWIARAKLMYFVVHPNHGWLKYQEDYQFRWKRLAVFWYTLKCLLCLAFCFHRNPDKKHKWFHDWIEVSSYNFAPYVTMEWSGDHSQWTSIEVGYGIFRNWYVRWYHDTSI